MAAENETTEGSVFDGSADPSAMSVNKDAYVDTSAKEAQVAAQDDPKPSPGLQILEQESVKQGIIEESKDEEQQDAEVVAEQKKVEAPIAKTQEEEKKAEPEKSEEVLVSTKEAKADFFDNFDAAFDGDYGQEASEPKPE